MDRQLLQQLCDERAIGLIEGAEQVQLDALIASGDPAALEQVAHSEEFIAQLAWMAAPVEPPALVRSQLLNRVSHQARQARPAPVEARPERIWSLGWAAAAALAVTSLYSYYALRGANSELRQVRGELASVKAEAAQSRKVLAVVLSRDARFIRLSAAQNEPLFRAFWGGEAGLVLSGVNVPAPAPGRTFQLWVVPKGGKNPVSAGVFTPQPGGQVLMIAETTLAPGDAAALAISNEPAGGSAQPTSTPVYVGTVGD
jgi:anti-sigma-K factor RskA